MTHTFIFLLHTSLLNSRPMYPLACWTSSLRSLTHNSNGTCPKQFIIMHYPFFIAQRRKLKNDSSCNFPYLTNDTQIKI